MRVYPAPSSFESLRQATELSLSLLVCHARYDRGTCRQEDDVNYWVVRLVDARQHYASPKDISHSQRLVCSITSQNEL